VSSVPLPCSAVGAIIKRFGSCHGTLGRGKIERWFNINNLDKSIREITESEVMEGGNKIWGI